MIKRTQKKCKDCFKRFLILFTFLLSAYHPFARNNVVNGIITEPAGPPPAGVNIVVKGSATGVKSHSNEEYRNVLSTPFDNPVMFEEKGDLTAIKPAIVDAVVVSGKVVDEAGTPLPGVNVLEKGVSNGTVTDIGGKYSLSVGGDAVLVFTFVGYVPQEIQVNSQATVDIQLLPDKKQLDEVVVVGYGTQRKIDVTGAVAKVKGEDILAQPVTNALEGLQGRVAGVDVSINSGQPGGMPTIIIRGVGSLNSSTTPLYVVDGVAMSDIRFLSPYDIQNVEVLKDASSSSIYGARGANGVILITTKRGGAVKGTHVTYDGSFSSGALPREVPVLNSDEFLTVLKEAMANNPIWGVAERTLKTTDPLLFNADGTPKYNTNWQREVTRMSASTNHEIGLQTKGENSSTGIFFNYSCNQGIMLSSDLKRYYLKVAHDSKISKWLDAGVNTFVNSSTENFINAGYATRAMLEYAPIFPVKFPDGEWANYQSWTDLKLDVSQENPVKVLSEQTNKNGRIEIFGNAFLNFKISKDLEFKTQFGLNSLNLTQNTYSPSNLLAISDIQRGVAGISNTLTNYWQQENFLTYKKQVNKHSINSMLGASWQENVVNSVGAKTQFFVDDFYREYNLAAGAQPSSPTSSYTRWSINSYFMRANYNFADKYFLTLSGRIDGSSRFGKANRYGFFPAAGLGYVLSKENFMKNFQAIDFLKLRAGYGQTGNTEIGSYQSLSTIQSGTVLINGARANSATPGGVPNPNLKWEKSTQLDIGLELEMFNDRITFEGDYYYKYTSDLLLNKPIPSTTGYQSVLANIGSVSNRGIDLALNVWPVKSADFDWRISFTANHNKNKVEKLGENNEDIYPSAGYTILRVGEPVSTLYGFKRFGTWGTEEVAAAKAADPNFSKKPGESKVSDDYQILGKTQPDWTGSVVNKFRYKNFDLTVDLQFSQGAGVVQSFVFAMEDRYGYSNSLKTVLNAWTPQNQNTPIQQYRYAPDAGQTVNFDSRWVANGSFIRGRNVVLGYNFNKKLLQTLKVDRIRFYISSQNLFLIKSKEYLGYDPQNSASNFDSSQAQGGPPYAQNLDWFSYPRDRRFTVGVNVNF